MSGLSRRALVLLGGAAAIAALAPLSGAAHAAGNGWVEVVGSATASGPADRDSARRRALADALLAAALAGGAQVSGHSVVSNSRLTSDLLVVRPTGRILAHELMSEHFESGLWRVRIRARVGAPTAGACPDRRHLVVTAYPPRVVVSPQAPAWADALGHSMARRLIDTAASHPAVAEMVLADRLPGTRPDRDSSDYRALTRGNARAQAGGHGLHLDLRMAPEAAQLGLTLRMRLEGPAGEVIEQTHVAAVRIPGSSILGRAASLALPDRATLAHNLGRGARPALEALLGQAGCQPVQARLVLADGRLTVPNGRIHGLTRTSLAFTVEPDRTIEMLEITNLTDRAAALAPLDPAHSVSAFQGRAVRFFDTAGPLP